MAYQHINFFTEHTNMDYPIGIYYIELSKMFMKNVQWHWHDELEIDFVRSGEADFCIGEETYHVTSGNAILINGNHLHSITSKYPEQCVIVSILFHQNYLFDSPKSFLYLKYCEGLLSNPSFHAILFSKDTPKGRHSIDAIQSILSTNLTKEHGYELMTKSHLCNFWMHLLEEPIPSQKANVILQQTSDEERTKKGILFIQDSYDKALTLDEIANEIHISKSECCRCFKRSIRLSPFEYLMQYRIFASAVQMQHSTEEESIVTLSDHVGFNNASYYNKIFKKFIGCTPTKYRSLIKTSHRDSLSPYGIPLTRM